MRKFLPVLLAVGIWMTATVAAAQTVYVNPVTKITMRTAPGTGNKIVSMLVSGSRLTVLEKGPDWTRVKAENGRSGWVLSRFLTTKEPVDLMVARLKTENQRLRTDLGKSESTNSDLIRVNRELTDIEQKYQKLRREAADVLKLEAQYKALLEQSQAQKEEIEVLEANADNEETLWFLSGAGVFIVGLILGLSTRKKKRYSLLD
ncbi:MAG: TIGR04211 family SH3 domain-containing protein [Desulfobacterales bacterium]|nr:TIGR04211 family SH3 domain-containing protein [Desulfobacterales bacterium]